MARRRVDGGKRIDTHEIRSADGRTLKIDVYMVRKSYDSGTTFRAICDEIDLDVSGDDVDKVTKDAKKQAAERCDVVWTPQLHVTVKGVRRPPPKDAPKKPEPDEDEEVDDSDDEDPDPPALPELFTEGRGYGGRQQTSFKLEIEVDRYETSTVAGKKVHRNPPDRTERTPQVRDGWPRSGRSEVYRSWGDPKQLGDMNALILDTPENRAALVRVREALADMTERLDDLLSPDKVEATLARVLAGGGPLALPPPSSAALTGEVVPEPTLEEKLAEPVPKGRVRVKKAWIGTRPPSEGGNGPRG